MHESDVDTEQFYDEDWLDRMYRKSKSRGTMLCAKTALSIFDQFCRYHTRLNGDSRNTLISKYKTCSSYIDNYNILKK